MKKYVNECVSCERPCIGGSCPNRHVPQYSCDECGEEFSAKDLFNVEGEELCIDCAVKELNDGKAPDDTDERYRLEDIVMSN